MTALRKLCTMAALLLVCGWAASAGTPRYACTVEKEFKHDAGSYTQGLFFYGGHLYESAGQYGQSSMRIVDLETGKVLKRKNFGRQYFIEGSCVCGGKLYILSWRENTCFVCDPSTLETIGILRYPGEGWGLTTDGVSLIMSDGSSCITFLNPANLAVQRTIEVTLGGKKVMMLNELEYIDGEIWSNVYGTDYIVRIDAATGEVNSVVDCTGLLPQSLRKPSTDVLNGIALDPSDGSIYVTGKLWPKLYRISARQLIKK